MTKGQLIKYTGSDDQIAEMINSEHGYIIKFGTEICDIEYGNIRKEWLTKATHYLICNPHPLRDMIKRQADTGQEVYIRVTKEDLWLQYDYVGNRTYKTTTPNWNIPNAEYSFSPFEEK